MPPPLPRPARFPALPTTASSCLLRPRARILLHGSPRAAAAAAPVVAAVAITDRPCSHYTSVAASPSPHASSSTSRARSGGDLVALAVTASAVAVSACLIFFLAVRSMLECKREAEFIEKYFDSARARLPQTMASVRLVGREVGDLAADLSDLSQELTKGMKTSMRTIHTVEAKLHQLTPSTGQGSSLRKSVQDNRVDEHLLASTVRDLRELIAGIRSGLGAASGMASAFMWASNFGSKRHRNR